MAVNHKYGPVSFTRGDIGDEEPVFVLRARDPLAAEVACFYLMLRAEAGVTPEMAADLAVAIGEIRDWQAGHGTKPADT